VCGMRWKIEQFHRELKQTTGMNRPGNELPP
jgi:hypothetical protein